MSLSLRDIPVEVRAYGETKLTVPWAIVLGPTERAVWKALCASLENDLELSFGALAQMAGLSMNATKNALYHLQDRGLLYGMPD